MPAVARDGIDPYLMRYLQDMLRQHNPYLQSFLSVNELIEAGHLNPVEVVIGIRSFCIRSRRERSVDSRFHR